VKELVPTGKLRFGVAFAPKMSALFVIKQADGSPRGITVDAAFMPVDDERKKRLDFGPAYCAVESTYMVMPASGIKTLAEVDRAGVRVVGVANTTTIRAAARTLQHTQPIAATSIDEAIVLLRDGKADAFALGRDSLPDFVAMFPGSFIVDGGFQQTVIAIAVPKGRLEALGKVTEFMREAKASGAVRRAMDAAGMLDLAVAP
jgi:polar amino acid transport system substrate-binding protein